VLSPSEEAVLRDEMTVRLMEATSHPAALDRARREERVGINAYDRAPTTVPDRRRDRVSWREQVTAVEDCALCGRAFVTAPGRGARTGYGLRFCSAKCCSVVANHRYRRGLVA
jgi:ribosomal protein L24E